MQGPGAKLSLSFAEGGRLLSGTEILSLSPLGVSKTDFFVAEMDLHQHLTVAPMFTLTITWFSRVIRSSTIIRSSTLASASIVDAFPGQSLDLR